MFKANKRDTRTTSVVNCEHVIAGWVNYKTEANITHLRFDQLSIVSKIY